MIGREELFALAAQPIGSVALSEAARVAFERQQRPPTEVVEASKRAQKVWLPSGKRSVVTKEAREAEAKLRARNFDIEDAVVAAGGQRGHSA